MAVIIAVAVNTDGVREILGVATGPSEAAPFWTDFLRGLTRRGLRGVKLVILWMRLMRCVTPAFNLANELVVRSE